jgi:hypothetical protein
MIRMLGEVNVTKDGPPLIKEIVTVSPSESYVFGSE